MTTSDATAARPATGDDDERHRLTALEGLAALSLDALSSVAYGPEAIVIVLVAAGTAGLSYTLPVTIAIVVLLAVLVISYRQVIAAFPDGGGAYAVAKRHLGTRRQPGRGRLADRRLRAERRGRRVRRGRGPDLGLPGLYGARVWLCLAVLALITAVNLCGVAESARLFIVPDRRCSSRPSRSVIVGGLIRVPSGRAAGAQPAQRDRDGRRAAAPEGVRVRLLGADRRGGDRQRGAPVPAAAGAPGPAHRDEARHPARRSC